MTEDQAKQRWCPYVRLVTSIDLPYGGSSAISSANRAQNDKPVGRCIGSDCMAWRWQRSEALDASRGYCGLAGRPE